MADQQRAASGEFVSLGDEQKVLDVVTSSVFNDGPSIVRAIREHHGSWKRAQGAA